MSRQRTAEGIKKMSLLSIVLPAYNEEQNIANTAKVLGELLDSHGIDYELVFISDGSKDGTFDRIKEEAAKNPRVRGAEFSRNFGKEAGIFAGLELTTGDAVIVMDCDLQHPPEVIPQMWEKWQQGAEIVEGIKSDRGRESLGYKLSAGLFYKIMSKLIKMDMNASSDFKLLDRKVVQVLLELPERLAISVSTKKKLSPADAEKKGIWNSMLQQQESSVRHSRCWMKVPVHLC